MNDTFRKEYKPLTDGQKEYMAKIKEEASELETLFNDINTPDIGREIALAKTNLEQSVMWAVKGLTA
jgi:hypothetical protein